ncbi:hypothetical protein EDB85DRAFT_853772 [Lactarius pseudohatsudake]|nr:hypothetical protein EDB85DRAFT_853772 [Lactarius pseudohatsudake]
MGGVSDRDRKGQVCPKGMAGVQTNIRRRDPALAVLSVQVRQGFRVRARERERESEVFFFFSAYILLSLFCFLVSPGCSHSPHPFLVSSDFTTLDTPTFSFHLPTSYDRIRIRHVRYQPFLQFDSDSALGMATVVTHQPRPVPAFRRQHSACIAYRSSPLIPNQSQSSLSFFSSMDLYPRSYRPNRPPQIPPSLHHHRLPNTPPYYSPQHRTMTPASAYPLVYSPSENSYHTTTPSMTADIQPEYPFDITFAGSGVSFQDFDLSQAAFLNPGQLPWSESNTDFKVESPPVPHSRLCAAVGSHATFTANLCGTSAISRARSGIVEPARADRRVG